MFGVFKHIWCTDTKIKMAWLSFGSGLGISLYCLHVDPVGEVSDSGLWLVGQFLALGGALLGVASTMDYKQRQFASYFEKRLDEKQDK